MKTIITDFTLLLAFFNTLLARTMDNKLFMVTPAARHTDLSDQKNIIPFGAMEKFFREY